MAAHSCLHPPLLVEEASTCESTTMTRFFCKSFVAPQKDTTLQYLSQDDASLPTEPEPLPGTIQQSNVIINSLTQNASDGMMEIQTNTSINDASDAMIDDFCNWLDESTEWQSLQGSHWEYWKWHR